MSWQPPYSSPTGKFEALAREAANDSSTISLGGGLPSPDQFPREELRAAFGAALDDPAASALQYDWPEGLESLRAFVSERLRRRGADVPTDDVIITSGAQQALAIAAQLIESGRPRGMVVDDETYPNALALFRAKDWTVHARRDMKKADAVYVMPALSNPRGQRMQPAECEVVLRRATSVIEDDAYAELAFDGFVPPPLLAQAPGRVWHVGTFSKTLCPGLRLGWLVPPSQEARASLKCKRDLDLQTGGMAQAVTARLLARFDYDAHLDRIRQFYRERAQALGEALTQWLPRWTFTFPMGGFCIWVEPDQSVDEVLLLKAARNEGVTFDAGSEFRCVPGGTALRLCHSLHGPAQLREGVRRLAHAYDRLVRRS